MGDYMNFLFNPNGRVSRKDIWLKYFLAVLLASFVGGMLDVITGLEEVGPFGAVVSLFFLWPGIAVPVKRFHDRGMTGWWVLILTVVAIVGAIMLLFPFFGLLTDTGDISGDGLDAGSSALMGVGGLILVGVFLFSFIVNYCLPGDVGPNKYGADPLDPFDSDIDVFD